MTKPGKRCTDDYTPTESGEKIDDGRKRDDASSPDASEALEDEPAPPRPMMLGLY